MNKILEGARRALAAEDLDALLVSCAVEDSFGRHGVNRRYLSGFSGSTGLVLLTADAAILAVDSRYTEQARDESLDFQIWQTPRERQRQWLPKLLADASLAGKRIGVSPDDMNVSEYVVVQEAAGSFDAGAQPEVVAAPRFLEKLRMRKTAAEQAMIEKAVAVADRAYERVLPAVAAGATERDLALAVESAVRAEGGDGLSFETIVASGPRASMPHAAPADRTVCAGEGVVIDMGAMVDGYCSDLTRTPVAGGEPSAALLEIYEVVLAAQEAAIDGVRAGMSGAEADDLARSVIDAAGHGEHFGHGLGHGVGLQVHEAPYLGATSEDVLEDGMVFTIEPGIYIPGWGGVRIEDVVVMAGGRARTLSRASKSRNAEESQ